MKFDVAGRAAYAYTGGRPLEAGQPLLALVHGAQHDHRSGRCNRATWRTTAIRCSRWTSRARPQQGPALDSVEEIARWSSQP